MCRAEGGNLGGGNLGEGTNSQMSLKFIATLLVFCCCPVVFAKPLASASYKDVCEQMDHQGISSRTQSDPNSQHLIDHVVIVVGTGHTSRRQRTQPVVNSDVVVGAGMTQINTVKSSLYQDSGLAAAAADPCR